MEGEASVPVKTFGMAKVLTESIDFGPGSCCERSGRGRVNWVQRSLHRSRRPQRSGIRGSVV